MRLIVAIIVSLLAVSICADTTFTIGAGSGSECDMAYINQAAQTTSYGSASDAYVYDSTLLGANVSLLFRWNALGDSLNHGGAPLYVKACSLLVKAVDAAVDWPSAGVLKIARCRRDPVTTSNWSEVQATWTRYRLGQNWSTLGARDVTNDVDTTAMSNLDFSTTSFGSDSVMRIDITKAAQSMDAGDTANAHGGFLIFVPWWGSFTLLNNTFHIKTDDNATTAHRPQLKVVYTKAVQPVAGGLPPRRRREMSMLDRIRIYSFTDKGELQCAAQ